VHLGLSRHQPRQYAAQAQRLLAQRRAHPVLAGGRGVALVEDEVHHLEHGGQALAQIGGAGQLEGHARFGQRALGAHDALGHGGLGHEEGTRDLVRLQPAEHAQRQGHPRLR